MNEMLLKDSIEVLKELRKELLGKAEGGDLQKLDKVIFDLEKAQRDKSKKISSKELLTTMGAAFELIPAIVEVIRLLAGMK